MTKQPCSGCTGPGPRCDHPERWGGAATMTRPRETRAAMAAVDAALRAAQAQSAAVATMTQTRPAVAPSAFTAAREPVTGPVVSRETARHIDGAEILSWTRSYVKRYLVLPSESAYTAVALWIAGTHFRDETGVLVHGEYPRLGFFSNEPGSGKTRGLEVCQVLCPAAPTIMVEPSEPAIALAIGKHHRTVLLDEGDVLFGKGNRKAAIRAIINTGYKRNGSWDRVRNGDLDPVPTYGALALAGLDVMVTGTGSTLEALLSRFIRIRMRKAVGQAPHKFREIVGTDGEGRPITGYDFGNRLKDLLAAFAVQERQAVARLIPQLPPGVELRQEELWAPLLAVAERADASSEDDDGAWQQTAWDACTDISLYGGTPDVIGESLDMLGGIAEGWEN